MLDAFPTPDELWAAAGRPAEQLDAEAARAPADARPTT